jgi:hypothetical protein
MDSNSLLRDYNQVINRLGDGDSFFSRVSAINLIVALYENFGH